MSAGALAFLNVRAHAARSRLLNDEALLRLRLAEGRMSPVLLDLGLESTPLGAYRVLWARLVDDYARLARASPGDPEPFFALVGRYEVENLKLLVRACLRGLPRERWRPWWRPLGALGVVDPDWEPPTLQRLAERAAGTRYRAVLEEAARVPDRAELALDRFATQRIADAARAAAREPLVAALLDAVVREREAELRRRAATFGLELPPAPPGKLTPAEARRRAIHAAFLASPLGRASAIALLLVEEERLARAIALAEGGG